MSENPIKRRGREGSHDSPPAQSGSALVLAIFVLVVLAGMGSALLFMSQSEVKMSQAGLRAKQAFYIAEAGLEKARLSLYQVNKGEPFDDDLETAAGGGVNPVMEFDPSLLQPVYDANGNVTGFTGYGDDQPLVDTAAFGNGWHIAFLTNDPVDGRLNLVDSNERVMITSYGAGPERSVEVVQAIVEMRDIFPSTPPATITILGPSPVFVGGTSAAKQFIGDDCDGSGGIPGFFTPVIGAIGSSGAANPCPPLGGSVTCGINKPATFQTGFGTYVGEDTTEDVTDPSPIGNVGPIDPNWLNCLNLLDIVEQVREAADVVCTPPTACTFPPSDPARIIFIDGDYDHGNSDGEGLIFVTGEMEMSGNASWSGMIYVIGEGSFIRKGGGNGVLTGAMFVADIAGPDDVFGTADDCTGGASGYGSGVYDASGGGTGDEIYCTDAINPALPIPPYQIVDFLQR